MTDDHKSLTVVLEAQLIRQIKAAAALAGKTIPQWIKEAATAHLKGRKAA